MSTIKAVSLLRNIAWSNKLYNHSFYRFSSLGLLQRWYFVVFYLIFWNILDFLFIFRAKFADFQKLHLPHMELDLRDEEKLSLAKIVELLMLYNFFPHLLTAIHNSHERNMQYHKMRRKCVVTVWFTNQYSFKIVYLYEFRVRVLQHACSLCQSHLGYNL